MTSTRPLILLAFSDPRRDLKNLKEESNGIRDIFWRFDDSIDVIVLDHPTLDQILTTFRRHRDRVAVFHYAGHANSFSLLLETSSGQSHAAGAAGLAEFLSMQKGLQVVFLNGCSTRGQVEDLRAGGVPCVIATTRPVNDEMATWFSRQFYTSLTTGVNLSQSFAEAKAAAKAHSGGDLRALGVDSDGAEASQAPAEFPWEIHADDQHAKALTWTLSRESHRLRRSRLGATPRETASERELSDLAEKVQSFWIDGVLQKKRGDVVLPEVQMQTRPDVISSPWAGVVGGHEKPSELMASGVQPVDVFDESQQSLLILGPPGTGKSTVMLQLAQQLLHRCKTEPAQPVPLVLHLSTWLGEHQSIEAWIQAELSDKYIQIPQQFSEQWLCDHRLILLLDGLDELPDDQRLACVNAVHVFLGSIGAAGIVICSRVEEYLAIPVPLRVGSAVCLQQYSSAQIRDFVSEDPHVATLKQLFDKHAVLVELARSPLMLSIMADVYEGVDIGDQSKLTAIDECSRHLFASYIARMFAEQPAQESGEQERIQSCLIELAHDMTETGETIFLVEHLQPSSLNSRGWKILHATAFAVTMGLSTGSLAWLFWKSLAAISNDAATRIDMGLGVWLVSTLIAWFLLYAVIEPRTTQWFQAGANVSSRRTVIQGVSSFGILIVTWIALMIPSLVYVEPRSVPLDDGPGFKMVTLMPAMLMTGTLASVLVGAVSARFRVMHEIKTVDALKFSWPHVKRGAFLGLFGSFSVWLSYLAWGGARIRFFWQSDPTYSTGTQVFLVCAVILGIEAGGILGGLVPRVVKKHSVNQGMKLTLHNALFVGGVSGTVFALTLVGLMMIIVRPGENGDDAMLAMPFAFSCGLAAAFTTFCWHGGMEVIKHALLRCLLVASGRFPLSIGRFLAKASRLNFLHRVGGGYIFMHRLLQEHFAGMFRNERQRESL